VDREAIVGATATVHRVLIVGNSLFAEAVTQLLEHSAGIQVTGVAADLPAAIDQLPACQPDIVMVLSHSQNEDINLFPLLAAAPDLSIIRAELNFDGFRIIHSRHVGTRTADLLTAILALPIRR
jgi:DNA-binding NarL/FixJ family response regulator